MTLKLSSLYQARRDEEAPCRVPGPLSGALMLYGRRKLFCIELILHTPCIPVSMLVLAFKAGGMMNLHVEDGVSECTQH